MIELLEWPAADSATITRPPRALKNCYTYGADTLPNKRL